MQLFTCVFEMPLVCAIDCMLKKSVLAFYIWKTCLKINLSDFFSPCCFPCRCLFFWVFLTMLNVEKKMSVAFLSVVKSVIELERSG